jgi:serine protease Do
VTLPDGRDLPARLLAHDKEIDLAALAVEADGLPAIELGDSHELVPGQLVLAMGHPWGVPGAVTSGVVIGMGSDLQESPVAGREWVVADLRLRPGHSGGPMMDAEGRLVGINTMIIGPDVTMAVPVHAIKSFLQDALKVESARR